MTNETGHIAALRVYSDSEVRKAPTCRGRGVGKYFGVISAAMFCLAGILQLFAYQNLEAPLVGLIVLLIGGLVFSPRSWLGGRHELIAFLLFFSICYFWAGVA